MSQRLTIHQFGPIADIDIDVNDILVFIGSQASGKSTVSKAIFFFKSLKDDLYRYYLDCYNQNKFNDPIFGFYKLIKQKFIKIYGYTVQPHNTKITYRYNDEIEISIEASENGGIGYPIFSNELIINFFKIINKLEVLHHDLNQNASIFSSSREISTIKSKETALFEDISNQLNNIFGDEREVIYLPAGRSLITTLSQQRYNIDMGDNLLSDGKLRSDNLIKLDYLMREFIDLIDQAKLVCKHGIDILIQDYILEKKQPNDTSIKIIKIAQGIVNSILKGSYSYQNGIEKIEFADGKSTVINKASQYGIDEKYLLPCICKAIDVKDNFFTKDKFNSLVNADRQSFLLNAISAKDEKVLKYIEIGEKTGIDKKYLTACRTPWYSLENRPPSPIWVSVFNRSGLKFVRNEANISNLTTFHCVYPVQSSLFDNVNIDILFAYLLTDVAREIFEDNRREYGNGLQKFEPNDLNKAMMLDLTLLDKKTENEIMRLYKKYRETVLNQSSDDSLLDNINGIFKNKYAQ